MSDVSLNTPRPKQREPTKPSDGPTTSLKSTSPASEPIEEAPTVSQPSTDEANRASWPHTLDSDRNPTDNSMSSSAQISSCRNYAPAPTLATRRTDQWPPGSPGNESRAPPTPDPFEPQWQPWDIQELGKFENMLQGMCQGIDPPGEHVRHVMLRLKRTTLTILPPGPDVDRHNTSQSCNLSDLLDETEEAFQMIDEILSPFDESLAMEKEREMQLLRAQRVSTWLDGLGLARPGYDFYNDSDEPISTNKFEPEQRSLDDHGLNQRATISFQERGGNVPGPTHNTSSQSPSPFPLEGKGILIKYSALDRANDGKQTVTKPDTFDRSASSRYSDNLRAESTVPVIYAIHMRYPLRGGNRVAKLRRKYSAVKHRWDLIREQFDLERRYNMTQNMLRLMIPILDRKSQLAFATYHAGSRALANNSEHLDPGAIFYTHT